MYIYIYMYMYVIMYMCMRACKGIRILSVPALDGQSTLSAGNTA